jgi:hypothetical protein
MHAYCTRSSSGMIDGPAPLALCLKSPPMPQSPTTPRNEGDCGLRSDCGRLRFRVRTELYRLSRMSSPSLFHARATPSRPRW